MIVTPRAAALAAMLLLCAFPAKGQEPRSGPAPASLPAALDEAPGRPGWRVQTLADGRAAAIGTGPAPGGTLLVGIACNADRAPEVAASRLGGPRPRTLLLESAGASMAFPIDARHDAEAPDALLFEAESPEPSELRLQLDTYALPARGARAAIAQVARDCRRRGWDYANDHERQLIWQFRNDDAPVLVFAKPSTGWVLAELGCDRRGRGLDVRATLLPSRARDGQTLPLTLRARGEEFSARARVETFEGGDVEGFVVARFGQPGALLARLRDTRALVLRAGKESMTVSGRGLAALLPRFAQACGL